MMADEFGGPEPTSTELKAKALAKLIERRAGKVPFCPNQLGNYNDSRDRIRLALNTLARPDGREVERLAPRLTVTTGKLQTLGLDYEAAAIEDLRTLAVQLLEYQQVTEELILVTASETYKQMDEHNARLHDKVVNERDRHEGRAVAFKTFTFVAVAVIIFTVAPTTLTASLSAVALAAVIYIL